jgi:MGT family glycosyltransferase
LKRKKNSGDKLSKIIFFSTPAHGHTNPTIPIVTELVLRGEEVFYFSIGEFEAKITSTKAIYQDYEFPGGFDPAVLGRNLAELYFGLISISKSILPRLLEKVKDINPDYIIHDSIAVWGRYIASICNIPAISSISTFAYSKKSLNFINTLKFIGQVKLDGLRKMIKARSLQKELFKIYGVEPRLFIDTMMNEESLNIVYCSRAFQPRVEDFDSRKYKFLGPMISKRENDPDDTDYSKMKRPLIYISMGTVWKDQFNINTVIDALQDLSGSLVFSGDENDLEKPFHGENIFIRSHINQLEVLKYCDVFITHGGMNSVNEGLFFKVPLCVHSFQAEQEEVSNRIVKLKCGIRINKLKKNAIHSAVQKVLKDKEMKNNCMKISDSFRESGGSKTAVDLILKHFKDYVYEE